MKLNPIFVKHLPFFKAGRILMVASNLLILSLTTTTGQERLDLLTISGRYATPQSYDSTYNGNGQEGGIMTSLVAPVVFESGTIWYNGLTHFYWNVNGEESISNNYANNYKLHGIILRTGLYKKYDNGTGFQLIFSPRLMSDMQNISGNSFQLGGMALYEKIYNDNLTVSYGALYNQELFGPYLVPLVNLKWKISNYWSISGLLPIYAKIKYQKTEKFSAGISHFGLITSYDLGNEKYANDYIQRSSIDLGLFGRYQLAGNLFIEGRIGHTFGRSYEQYSKDDKVKFAIPLVAFGDNRKLKNVVFKDGVIASFRLVYAIQLPED